MNIGANERLGKLMRRDSSYYGPLTKRNSTHSAAPMTRYKAASVMLAPSRDDRGGHSVHSRSHNTNSVNTIKEGQHADRNLDPEISENLDDLMPTDNDVSLLESVPSWLVIASTMQYYPYVINVIAVPH